MNPEPLDMSGSGVPEVEQERRCGCGGMFGMPDNHIVGAGTRVAPVEERTEERVARHALNKPLIEAFDALRTGNHDGPLPHLAPPYCGVCSPYGGSDPERTGVSDVQAEVLEEVEALRRELEEFTRVRPHARSVMLPRLDRIASAVRRGEQK